MIHGLQAALANGIPPDVHRLCGRSRAVSRDCCLISTVCPDLTLLSLCTWTHRTTVWSEQGQHRFKGKTPFLPKSKHPFLWHTDFFFFSKWLVTWALLIKKQAKILQHIFHGLPLCITYCDVKWIWRRQLPRVIVPLFFLIEKQCWNYLSFLHPLWLPRANSVWQKWWHAHSTAEATGSCWLSPPGMLQPPWKGNAVFFTERSQAHGEREAPCQGASMWMRPFSTLQPLAS